MSESSIDKTKRKIVQNLNNDYYCIQQSIFFKEYEPKFILESYSKIRAYVKNDIESKTFWLARAKYAPISVFEDIKLETDNKYLKAIYIQFYTARKSNLEKMEKKIMKLLDIRCEIKSRPFVGKRKESWLKAVKSQKLNDLSFANHTGRVIRRCAITNKNYEKGFK